MNSLRSFRLPEFIIPARAPIVWTHVLGGALRIKVWKKLFERVGRCIRRVHEVEGSEYHLSCSLTRFKISVLLLVYCSEDFRLLPVCNTFRMVASFQYSMH